MFNLVIIRPDGKEVEEGFTGHQTLVGRHERCDLRLVDSMVSGNHCMILSEGKRFIVKDLESRNGTWVNGRKIKKQAAYKRRRCYSNRSVQAPISSNRDARDFSGASPNSDLGHDPPRQ